MPSIGWLHLSDLHHGLTDEEFLWPQVREQFFADLVRLHKRSGPWDVVLFTGDLTQRGAAAEFAGLDRTLERLWRELRALGSDPKLLAVPGNHDLVRPDPAASSVVALGDFHAKEIVRRTFWKDAASDYRRLVAAAFGPFTDWWSARKHRLRLTPNPLPGDFTATVEKDGLRLGIAGLNSAFLQLTAEDYRGRLALDVRQLHDAAGGDAPDWARAHHATLLLTHHPPGWLAPSVEQHLRAEILPAGRFLAHLYGHMHEPRAAFVRACGGEAERHLQAPSLFGLEHFADGREERLHGYTAGRVTVEGGEGTLRIWPRTLIATQDGRRKMVADQRFDLDDNECFAERFGPIAPAPARPIAAAVDGNRAIPIAAPPRLQTPGAAYQRDWYVHREPEERAALAHLGNPGAPAVVWGPKRFGKSTFLHHLLDELSRRTDEKWRTVRVDLDSFADESRDSLDHLLHAFALRLVEALDLPTDLVAREWERPGDARRKLSRLIERQVLAPLDGPLALAIDRVDAVWELPFQDDFFGLLRGWGEDAREPWSRLRLLLAVSTTPSLLTRTVHASPFNLTPPIQLGEFDRPQTQALARLHGLDWSDTEFDELKDWVGGHPFLLRMAMFEAKLNGTPLARILGLDDMAHRLDEGIYAHHLQQLTDWLRARPHLLEAVGRVLADGAHAELDFDAYQRLHAAGLLDRRRTGDGYVVRHQLYRRYFKRLFPGT